LRLYCLKGEAFLNEMTKPIVTCNNSNIPNKKVPSRRHIYELDVDLDSASPPEEIREELDVEAITRTSGPYKLFCWNCRKEGHKFQDCMGVRSVFCFGCGLADTYKPTCPKCNSGNFQRGEPQSRTFAKTKLI
ncbi:hypothetical protein PSTG_19700, partial [Puccinia striiformis f. sp. tritici PST-78]